MEKALIEKQEQLIDQWVANLEKDEPLPHLSDVELKGLYAYAHRFYTEGKYEEAVNFFNLLTLFAPSSDRYWMGLGASFQMLKKYEDALKAYAHAALIKPTKAEISLHAAQCFFSLEQHDNVNSALKAATKMAKDNKVVLTQIAQLKKRMKLS